MSNKLNLWSKNIIWNNTLEWISLFFQAQSACVSQGRHHHLPVFNSFANDIYASDRPFSKRKKMLGKNISAKSYNQRSTSTQISLKKLSTHPNRRGEGNSSVTSGIRVNPDPTPVSRQAPQMSITGVGPIIPDRQQRVLTPWRARTGAGGVGRGPTCDEGITGLSGWECHG